MRIIFLNSWYAQAGKQYFDFINEGSSSTDVFCLQEVDINLHKKLSSVLNDFNAIESHKNIGPYDKFDISIFINRKFQINNHKVNIISDRTIGDCVTIEISDKNKNFLICVVHGIAQPGDKLDSPGRLKQSEEILEAVRHIKLPRIIGGDFNLFPETKSIKMFEEAGYRNLIKDFGTKTTRNRLSWEQFNNVQHFADYVFVSPGVKVKSFEVPNIEISDHEPLILDFEI